MKQEALHHKLRGENPSYKIKNFHANAISSNSHMLNNTPYQAPTTLAVKWQSKCVWGILFKLEEW